MDGFHCRTFFKEVCRGIIFIYLYCISIQLSCSVGILLAGHKTFNKYIYYTGITHIEHVCISISKEFLLRERNFDFVFFPLCIVLISNCVPIYPTRFSL